MEIDVAKERVLWLKEEIALTEAAKIADENKQNAFGAIQKVTSFLRKPTASDYVVTHTELRYFPFWHVAGTSKYIYDRTVEHQWPTNGPEVVSITLLGKDFVAKNDRVAISVMEHCQQEETQEVFVDGVSTLKRTELNSYLKFISRELTKAEIEEMARTNIVLPPQVRASSLVRDIASKMIRSIDADQILEEHVQFQNVDLYYRPVYVFNYHHATKDKDSVIEVDGLTKKVTFSQSSVLKIVGNVFDYDLLFDIGKDAAGMFIPGGGIAMKIAKKYMDVTHFKK